MKRNCQMGMPMMMPPMMMQPYNQMPTDTYDNDLTNRINNLEKRVSILEYMLHSNSYNSSHYQML